MMSSTYASPSGPPPGRPAPQVSLTRADSLDTAIPDEPPPAYTPSANPAQGEHHLEAGPSRPDFSGPPPMPDHLQQQQQHAPPPGPPPTQNPFQDPTGVTHHLTGVGDGHFPRYSQQQHLQPPSQDPSWIVPNATGGILIPQTTGRYPVPPPLPPPQHPSLASSSSPSPVPTPIGNGPSGSRPSPPPLPARQPSAASGAGAGVGEVDVSPTEAPVPGRPLLRNGQILVYPKDHWCAKCNNTGYKAADPSNPCKKDWQKYAKPYTSAMAHSYTLARRPGANLSTTAATNFQQSLPANMPPRPTAPMRPSQSNLAPPPPPPPQHPPAPPQNPYGHLPPPPGQAPQPQWHQYPGQSHMPPPMGPMGYPAVQGGNPIFVHKTYGMPPPGALVLPPGHPQLGGTLCMRCGGDGREYNFLGIDEGRCRDCRGVGRMFR